MHHTCTRKNLKLEFKMKKTKTKTNAKQFLKIKKGLKHLRNLKASFSKVCNLIIKFQLLSAMPGIRNASLSIGLSFHQLLCRPAFANGRIK